MAITVFKNIAGMFKQAVVMVSRSMSYIMEVAVLIIDSRISMWDL